MMMITVASCNTGVQVMMMITVATLEYRCKASNALNCMITELKKNGTKILDASQKVTIEINNYIYVY